MDALKEAFRLSDFGKSAHVEHKKLNLFSWQMPQLQICVPINM
jgi:hypothetical protein